MSSSLPVLTWQMTNLRVPQIVDDPQSVLDTIALCVGDSTTWEVKSSTTGSLVLGCVAGSATPDLRVIVNAAINSNAPWQRAGSHQYMPSVIYIAICPDNGINQDPFVYATPSTNAATRFSRFSQASMKLSAKDCNNVFVITADEVISIHFNYAAADDWWTCIAGAMFDPPSDADGEGTPGRLYGMATCGWGSPISNAFWSANQGFLATGGGNYAPATGVFDPVTPTNYRDVDRYYGTIAAQPNMSTAGGTQVSIPWAAFFEDAPKNYVGLYRQMRFTNDGMMRQIIQNAAGVDQSYWVSQSQGSNGDVLSFDQG